MKRFLEVEVFRAGDYGPKGTYSPDDLDAMCADYSPALHEAPVTVDHAQSGPAYGWAHALARRGDVLVATLKDLSDEFLELIRAGAFKKRSVEIYRRFQATGRPYLRAISFLGACPPEVKGLADPVFAEGGEPAVYEFAEVPNPDGAPAPGNPSATLNAQHPNLDSQSAAANMQRPSSEAATMAEGARRERVERFCRRMADEGRIVPAWERAGLVDFMMTLTCDKGGADGDVGLVGKSQLSPLDWFEAFVAALPIFAPMGEVARPSRRPADAARGGLPSPHPLAPVSAASVRRHEEALAFLETHPGAAYAEALRQTVSDRRA